MAEHNLPVGWTLHDPAILSPSGRYRYWLRRNLNWIGGERPVVFCMLNPSTADASNDDPTIRRCIDYANRWKASILAVVNLFAMRSTDPDALFEDGVSDPEGPDNDSIIRAAANFCRTGGAAPGIFVCGWGGAGKNKRDRAYVAQRAETVRGIVEDAGCEPMFLKLSVKSGQPWHPLYLKAELRPRPWPAPATVSAGEA